MAKYIRRLELPVDGKGSTFAAHVISASLAVKQYTVTTGTEQDHTLDTSANVVIITVADYPVKMKADTTATASDYDHYLLTGQYVMPIGEDTTDISFIADGGDALVTIVERGDI